MIELLPGDEGELLIRRILLQKGANTDADTHILQITPGATSGPSLPQIAARAGFERIVISGTGPNPAISVTERFLWRGIDGTSIPIHAKADGDGSGAAPAESGNLNLPTHYGELPNYSYNLHHANNQNRRRLAAALHDAEFLSVVNPTGLANYPYSEFESAWYTLLSARSVDADFDLLIDQAISDVEEIKEKTIAELASAIDTRGLKRPLLVVNYCSFFANEAVRVRLLPGERPVTAIGPEGEAEPVQILDNPDGDGINYALFIAKNVPLHGYAVWDLGATLSHAEMDDELSASTTHLENGSIRVEFDKATGLILKIFDKDNERDVLNETFEVQRSGKRDLLLDACGNRFDISETHTFAGERVTSLDNVEVIENGPVRGAVRITRTLPERASTITQTIRLTTRSARIDFVTEMDGFEGAGDLTVSFPVAIHNSRATYEVPFGIIEHPTHFSDNVGNRLNNNGCHDWVDFSEGDYGAALLNAGHYNCHVRGNCLRLILSLVDRLRPQGGRTVSLDYSLLPHGGDLREGEVVENSQAINRPLTCTAISANKTGKLPLERSFIEVDRASVFIETIKRAQKDECAIIVRLYEAYNTRGIVLLTTTLPVKSAWLCDLLENNLGEIPLDNGEALLPFHPFEIITVKFKL